MNDIRIAAVSCRAVVGDIDGNLDRTAYWTRRAKEAGAALVCFPELNLTGYGIHASMAVLAQPIPGPLTNHLSQLALESGLVILAGLIERNPQGPPFVSHCVFQPTGGLAVYRKLHLAPNEQAVFARGEELPLFQSGDLRFGIQLCYDGHFPELATAMTQAGADVIFLPHASPRGDARSKHRSWMRHLPARAYDNGIFVVACNQSGDNRSGLRFPGNALVLDPSGRIVGKHLSGDEGILTVDLTHQALAHVRSHPLRYFFANRRPELYK